MGMKEEYASQDCAICGSQADGLHYGAISCRSCNAFFRRTVVEKSNYRCKHNNACQIDIEARCSCRACRFQKCLDSGMKISSVQPRRDPTGSQNKRRKRLAEASLSDGCSDVNFSPSEDLSRSILIDAIKTDYDFAQQNQNHSQNSDQKMIKKEVDEDIQPCTSDDKSDTRVSGIDEDEQREYQQLVYAFNEHQRMMQLSFTSCEKFLDECKNGPSLRVMNPTDVNKLSAVELTGLLYWIEKLHPFRDLPEEDKGNLLKRYSVRKLSLDHFYSASKHPDYVERDEFVMNNYTYVAKDKTGFELPDDDEKQVDAKRHTFAPTFKRFWKTVIQPFIDLKVGDSEVVFLHIMLLWSQSNHEHVSEFTRNIMKERRDWAIRRLFEWYKERGFEDPDIRLGQMILLLGEIETICELHCQDFQVAKMFEFCDMSDFWYETLCYAPCNTNTITFDPDLLDNLKKFTAIGMLEKTCNAIREQETQLAIANGKEAPRSIPSTAMQTLERSILANGYIPGPTEVLPRDQKPLIPDLQKMTVDFTGTISMIDTDIPALITPKTSREETMASTSCNDLFAKPMIPHSSIQRDMNQFTMPNHYQDGRYPMNMRTNDPPSLMHMNNPSEFNYNVFQEQQQQHQRFFQSQMTQEMSHLHQNFTPAEAYQRQYFSQMNRQLS